MSLNLLEEIKFRKAMDEAIGYLEFAILAKVLDCETAIFRIKAVQAMEDWLPDGAEDKAIDLITSRPW